MIYPGRESNAPLRFSSPAVLNIVQDHPSFVHGDSELTHIAE